MKAKISILLSFILLLFCGCNDFLDRPPLTELNDENFWTSESNLKLFAAGFYDHFFIGYSTAWLTTANLHSGFQRNDNYVYNGTQSNFERSVPNDRGNNLTDLQWIEAFGGLNWNFVWVRKANVMIDRLKDQMSNVLTTDAMNHWMGVARFFRALEYSQLVSTFGDVPFYDREIGSAELDELYKQRTPRNDVMDAIYNDFVFALENVRGDLGSKNEANTYIVAGFVSRWALFEGSWQKYHENNSVRAQKFFELAVRAAEVVMSSGRFAFSTDFRSLFGSQSLSGVAEVIMSRRYDDSQSVTHSQASLCNMVESQSYAPNLSLIKSFICNDGSDWQTSENADNKNFSMANLIRTRDSRFEASFYKQATYKGIPSCLYIAKFINREGHNWVDAGLAGPPSQYLSTFNTSDAPVLRYAEVVLNWVEAKAELGNVTQSDIDRSINAIRSRPLAAAATAAGVQRTAPLELSNLPNSPDRGDVPQLLWEIRRERRMEFVGEFSRLHDLRRWKKLEYMDGEQNPDIMRGTWVKLSEIRDLPSNWTTVQKDLMGVVSMDGTKTVFDGTNPNIEGFYYRVNVVNRLPFLDVFNVNPYLAPIGRNQRQDYKNKGYDLAQTKGWPDEF